MYLFIVLYPCILVSFIISLHTCIPVSLYPYIPVSLYPCIHGSLYTCIHVSLYSFTHVYLENRILKQFDDNPKKASPQTSTSCTSLKSSLDCSAADWPIQHFKTKTHRRLTILLIKGLLFPHIILKVLRLIPRILEV